jgi:hypothetical protein
MIAQTGREFPVRSQIDQRWQRLSDLLFRVIAVVQLMQEQVLDCIDVFEQESHGSACRRFRI